MDRTTHTDAGTFPGEPGILDAVYLLVAMLALPWVAWRKLSGGRPVAAPWRRFTGRLPPLEAKGDSPRVWLHGVSVGEVNLLHRLAEEIRRVDPAIDCVASSSTTTGLELATARFGPQRTFPCPLDFSWAVKAAIDQVRPDLIVLGELELWPNLLGIAQARGIPVFVANGRMSDRSLRGYRRLGGIARRMLSRLELVLARSDEDADRFRALGATAVEVTGSMKFDGVACDRAAAGVRALASLAGLGDGPVFVAGSTQAPEELLAIDALLAVSPDHPGLRLLIVPRHVERAAEIARLLDSKGVRWQRRSRLEADGADPEARVLLVDTTGELSRWWGTATVAFVGGSLDGKRGGQNMLEPAAYGVPLCFGPHTWNFREEVAMLLAAGGAEVVHDGRELEAFVRRALGDRSWSDAMASAARSLVEANRGAVGRTAERVVSRVRRPRTPESHRIA